MVSLIARFILPHPIEHVDNHATLVSVGIAVDVAATILVKRKDERVRRGEFARRGVESGDLNAMPPRSYHTIA
jgi:hypothetical protein